LKLSWQVNVLKVSQAGSCVNVELKTNVSEISSVSIITVNVVNESGLHIKIEVLAKTSSYMN
jgi:hypothetical protein